LLLVSLLTLGAFGCGPKSSKADKKVAAKVETTNGRDRELFESALELMRKGRYEAGRIQLSILIGSYADSPYLPLAKIATADSYFREGGTSNLAQAEAEYQNWLSFFSTTHRTLASQVMYKIAEIHVRQMLAFDRDQKESHAAERTLMALMQQYPDAAVIPEVKTKLDQIRERLAESDLNVAKFYYTNRGAMAGAEDRLKEIIEKYPHYSKMDEVYHMLGLTEEQREDTEQAGKYFSQLAQQFPNSAFYQDSIAHLKKYDMKVPPPDPNAPPAKEKMGMVSQIKSHVFDPTIETSEDGILLKKNGKPDEAVMKALADANNAWTTSPTPVTTTVGITKSGNGGTSTATPGQNQGKTGDVKVGVGGPDKPDDKDKDKKKGPDKPNN